MKLTMRKSKEHHCVQLTELKTMFDNAIRNGHSFRSVKRIYARIKHLKRYLNSINVE